MVFDLDRYWCKSCILNKYISDRRFPSCLVCEKTMQTCSYPTSRLKSGPKIGTNSGINIPLFLSWCTYWFLGSTHRKKKFTRFSADKEKSLQDNGENFVRNIESHTNSKQDESPPRNRNRCISNADLARNSNPTRQNRSDTSYSDSNSIPSYPSPPEITNDTPLNSLDGIRLSYIVHPTHDTNAITPSSDSGDETPEPLTDVVTSSDALSETCCVLDISRETLQKL